MEKDQSLAYAPAGVLVADVISYATVGLEYAILSQ